MRKPLTGSYSGTKRNHFPA